MDEWKWIHVFKVMKILMIDLRIEFRLDKILEQSVKIEQVNNQY